MTKINAWAAEKAAARLSPFAYTTGDRPGPFEVDVRISHCGICHSDLHLIDNDWMISEYPLVPGHEIVGTVQAVGAQVSSIEVGQRVGIGWQRSSCMHCEHCIAGEENYCAQQQATCVGHFGGFAEFVRVDGRFAFALPETLSSENAAPLLCGGVTVYTPFRLYDIPAHARVAVVGIGGLGHLALQYARAMGCEVTAFTSTPEKEKELLAFGAHRVVSSTDEAGQQALQGYFDFILSTVYADLNWMQFVGLLRPKGRLCFVGAPKSEVRFPAFALISGAKSLCGSVIGGRRMIRDMLAFSARHGIVAQTELFPLERVNDALDRLRRNEVRYRAVLKV